MCKIMFRDIFIFAYIREQSESVSYLDIFGKFDIKILLKIFLR